VWGPQGVCDSEHGACAGGRTCNVVLVRKGRDGDGVSRSNKEYAFVYFIQKHSLQEKARKYTPPPIGHTGRVRGRGRERGKERESGERVK
jgi:hypothetical protein